MSSHPPLPPTLRILAAAALTLALWVLHFQIAAQLQGSFDSYRDLWYAAAIQQGIDTGGLGPRIDGIFHLGPAWYHVLAWSAPLLGAEHALLLLVSLGLALPPALALLLGWQLRRPRVGIALAALLAVPGWNIAAAMLATHTAWVVSGQLLLALATAHALRRPALGSALAFGVSATLVIHAHPTTATFVVAALVLLAVRRSATVAASHAAAALLCLVFAMWPVWSSVFAQELSGVASWSSAIPERHDILQRWLGVMAATPFAGSWTGLIGAGMAWHTALWLALVPWLIALGMLLAAWKRGFDAGVPAWAFSLFALQALLLVFSRDLTPPWMALSLAPPLLFAVAWIVGTARVGRSVFVAAIAASGIVALAILAVLVVGARRTDHEVHFARHAEGTPGAMSIESWPVGHGKVRIIPYRFFELGELFPGHCARVSLHGMLAPIADRTLGYPWLAACGRQDHVSLGGRGDPPAVARFGFWDPRVGEACGSTPFRLRNFPRASFDVLNTSVPMPMADARRYPARDMSANQGPAMQREVLLNRRFLSLAAISPYHFPLRLDALQFEDQVMQRVDGSGFTLVECAQCSKSSPGRVSLRLGNDARQVDLVAFDCPSQLDEGRIDPGTKRTHTP